MDQEENITTGQSEALNQLVKELGIDTLPQDKQNEIIIKMTEVLLKRIFLETMDRLGDDGMRAYEELTKSEDVTAEQVEAFFKERITDYAEMVEKVVAEFKGEMLKAQEPVQAPAPVTQEVEEKTVDQQIEFTN